MAEIHPGAAAAAKGGIGVAPIVGIHTAVAIGRQVDVEALIDRLADVELGIRKRSRALPL